MKILIVSIYDGAYGFSVYDNGKICDRDEIDEDENHKFYKLWQTAFAYRDVNKLIEKEFINDYDKIFICENGGTEVVK